MDLVGPYAQTTDCPLEKWYRDAKIYQIFEGTAQVQRLVVSRMQRREYQERLKEAAEVLEQVPSVAATAASRAEGALRGTLCSEAMVVPLAHVAAVPGNRSSSCRRRWQ